MSSMTLAWGAPRSAATSLNISGFTLEKYASVKKDMRQRRCAAETAVVMEDDEDVEVNGGATLGNKCEACRSVRKDTIGPDSVRVRVGEVGEAVY